MSGAAATGVRWITVLVCLAALVPARASAQCSGQPLVMSGKTTLACVDTNGDGVLDSADCCLSGFATLLNPQNADVCLVAQQGSSPTKIRGCQGDRYMGSSFLDPVEGAGFTDLNNPHFGPFDVDFGVDPSGPMPPPNSPVTVEQASAFQGFFPFLDFGSGAFIRSAGLELDVTVPAGMTLQFGSSKKHSGGVDWQCFLVPLPTLNGMSPLQLFNLCLPVGPDGNAVLTLADAPGSPLLLFLFGNAGGASPAPALTRLGLIALVLVLLGVGTVAIRRWQRFAEGFPRH
jgi:hypothetical protein